MFNFRAAVYLAIAFSFVASIKGQTNGATTTPGSTSKDSAQATIDSPAKQAIEQRFLSMNPVPLADVDGAVPGRKLIEARRRRTAAQLNRIRASGEVHPMGGSSTTNLPGLQLRANLPAGGTPTSVITGDFNRDGHMDFIVANGNDSDLWIYFGKGDGTFQEPQIIPLSQGLSPVFLATADLRGSGKLDLVVAEYDTSTIGVLLGNGDGTFGFEQSYTLPEPPVAIAVADFNHDGKLDIVAAMFTAVAPAGLAVPSLAMLTGDGAGHFNAPTFSYLSYYSHAVDLDAADVNGDGLPDLLVTGTNLDNSTIFLNAGNGTFTKGQTILAYGPFDMPTGGRFADVNEDGCPDAVVSDYNTAVVIEFGDCKGNFTGGKTYATGDSNAAIRLADVNGDGHLDILTTSETEEEFDYGYTFGNSLNVMLGDGKGNFGVAHTYLTIGESLSLATAAFKDGGLPSVVTANTDSDTSTVFLNNGSGNFGFPQGVLMGSPATVNTNPMTDASFADLNGDGKADTFFFTLNSNGNWITSTLLNDGTGAPLPPLNSDTGVSANNVGIGDYRLGNYRGTGKMDAVALSSNAASPQVVFVPGNGDGTFGKGTTTIIAGAEGIMATGDFNGDGKLDFVAVSGNGTDTLTPFLGNGDGTFHAGTPVSFTDGNYDISRAYAGDFNRDGKLDVLVFTTTNAYLTNNSTVWEFLGNGDGTFQAGKQILTDFQPMTLADLNGDGHPDIARYDFVYGGGVSTYVGTAKFTNYLGQADGSFLQTSSYAPYNKLPIAVFPLFQSGDPLTSTLTADLNGDGKLDEVALQEVPPGGYFAQILMGNGDGTFMPTYDIFPFYAFQIPIYAHDMDGDGTTDMIEMDTTSNSIYVIKGGAAPALQLELNDAVVQNNSSCGVVFADMASASARTVTFSSSLAGVLLPASVLMPANALSVNFCYTLSSSFNSRNVFDVNATMDGSTATAYASSTYTLGFSETVTPTTTQGIYDGQSTAPVTVTLTSLGGYSSTVNLSCPGLPVGDSCQFTKSTLTLPANGSVTTTVVLSTSVGATQNLPDQGFTITASDSNVTQRQTVEVPVSTLAVNAPASAVLGFVPGQVLDTFYVGGLPPYTFSCSGLPAGTTCSFSGTQNAYPAVSTITLTVSLSSSLVKGSYPFTIQVASNGESISSQATLYALGLNVQAPTSGDWTIAGYTRSLPLTMSTTSAASGYSFTLTCALDVSGTCAGGYGYVNTTPYTSNLTINVPTGVTLGQHNVTVTAALNGTTQSATVPFYVTDFSGSLSTSALTMNPSTTSTVTATLSAMTGFSGQVALSCNYVAQVTCAFSPSSPQLTAASSVPVTITIATNSLASVTPGSGPWGNRSLTILAALLPMAWFLRRRRPMKALLSVAGLFLLASLMSCSSGGSGSGSGGGTPTSKVYTLTVSAESIDISATHTLGTVTVTVPH